MSDTEAESSSSQFGEFFRQTQTNGRKPPSRKDLHIEKIVFLYVLLHFCCSMMQLSMWNFRFPGAMAPPRHLQGEYTALTKSVIVDMMFLWFHYEITENELHTRSAQSNGNRGGDWSFEYFSAYGPENRRSERGRNEYKTTQPLNTFDFYFMDVSIKSCVWNRFRDAIRFCCIFVVLLQNCLWFSMFSWVEGEWVRERAR